MDFVNRWSNSCESGTELNAPPGREALPRIPLLQMVNEDLPKVI